MFALQLWFLEDIFVAFLGKKIMGIVDFISSPFKPNITNLKLIIGDTTFQWRDRIHKGLWSSLKALGITLAICTTKDMKL